jgi:hypothetical protein
MEPTTQPRSKKSIVIVAIVILALIAGGTFWYRKHSVAPFCFNFKHDTQFGDRKVAKPSNIGVQAPNGMFYYLPEVPALQTALSREGFYIDTYEATGGKVYYAAFFGPSTQVAVREFQKKYGMAQTGEVDNTMIDKLASLYGCPAEAVTATTTKK